jgi:membrane protein required for colicin V production
MQGLDLVILIFTAFLLVKGIWKGFVKEIAGILAVVLAVAVSFSFHKDTAGYLVSFIGEKYAAIAAYLALFLAVYLVVMLLGNVLDRVLKSIFLGGFNRVLGGVFGLLKSVLWLTLVTFAYSSIKEGTGLQHSAWIIDSLFYPFLLDLTEIIATYLV